MSVFTTVTFEQMQHWLQRYAIGDLVEFKGIAAGITNTNYFVVTEHDRFVLTLFEQNTLDELPKFLNLMAYLSQHGIPCPAPLLDKHGLALHELNGKPAVLLTCLQGSDVEQPSPNHCALIGQVMARMHEIGRALRHFGANPRDIVWRAQTAQKVRELLSSENQQLLDEALQLDTQLAQLNLPQSVIHADLFRDNALFDGAQLGGVIDFYYACEDAMLYDLAITANDWCTLPDGEFDLPRLQALLQGYSEIRPLTDAERLAWQGMLRIAALRFWLSRLLDWHFPHAGELTHAKDPAYFEHILRKRGEGAPLPL